MLQRSWISGTLTEESMYLIVGYSTSKEMWECLEETYFQQLKIRSSNKVTTAKCEARNTNN